jgi:hypothetical protein
VSWRYSVRQHRAEQRRVARILSADWRADVAKAGWRLTRCCESFMGALNLKTATVKHCPLHCDLMLCQVCLHHRHRTTIAKATYCIEYSTGTQPSIPYSGPVGEFPGQHALPLPYEHTIEDTGDMLRHIVLTTPRWDGDVREGAERLARWFGNMKRRKAWRLRVDASMGVFETTYSDGTKKGETKGWGWHVHCLTIGQWWRNQCQVRDVKDERRPFFFIGPLRRLEDYGTVYTRPANPAHECECVKRVGEHGRRNAPEHRCLSQEWYQVTGGEARIVHISAAGAHHREERSNAIAEAVKYVVKTMELNGPQLIEFIQGMRHFQRVRWGGEWMGLQPPDNEAHEPRVMVCPTDLWRLSTGIIGELFARLTNDSAPCLAAAEAAGWKLVPFEGPILEGRARPPPEVKLLQAFAVAAVESLETASDDLDTKTTKYFAGRPDRALAFTVSTVPY